MKTKLPPKSLAREVARRSPTMPMMDRRLRKLGSPRMSRQTRRNPRPSPNPGLKLRAQAKETLKSLLRPRSFPREAQRQSLSSPKRRRWTKMRVRTRKMLLLSRLHADERHRPPRLRLKLELQMKMKTMRRQLQPLPPGVASAHPCPSLAIRTRRPPSPLPRGDANRASQPRKLPLRMKRRRRRPRLGEEAVLANLTSQRTEMLIAVTRRNSFSQQMYETVEITIMPGRQCFVD